MRCGPLCITSRYGQHRSHTCKKPKGEGWATRPTIVDGKLEGVRFDTSGAVNSDEVMKTLIAQYGKPTSTSASQAAWDLDGISVTFESSPGLGSVSIETSAAIAYNHNSLKRKSVKHTGPAL